MGTTARTLAHLDKKQHNDNNGTEPSHGNLPLLLRWMDTTPRTMRVSLPPSTFYLIQAEPANFLLV